MKSIKTIYYKLVCVEVDPLEYIVHEDLNRADLEEIHNFVKEGVRKYPMAKWLLIPIVV